MLKLTLFLLLVYFHQTDEVGGKAAFSIFNTRWIPHQIVEQVLRLISYNGAAVVNGEIGIAMMQDEITFMSICEALSDWKKEGVLIEKCKELDTERLTKTLK